MDLEIRPFRTKEEYCQMVDYFTQSTDEFLRGMGIDPLKVPSRESWLEEVWEDHHRPGPEKDRFYLVWIYDGELVGHSSINKIQWGEEGSIHLHLWKPELRKNGIGSEFFRRSIDFYFRELGLKKVYCEPYAENAAPNKVLPRLGFTLVSTYKTIPGKTCFVQNVNRWELLRPAANPEV
jgi:RimJ/RimL family protein N-acetyltransferase